MFYDLIYATPMVDIDTSSVRSCFRSKIQWLASLASVCYGTNSKVNNTFRGMNGVSLIVLVIGIKYGEFKGVGSDEIIDFDKMI
jgi:hypothetical protein